MPRNKSRSVTRLSTYRPLLDRLIFGLALLGILTSVHLNIQQSRGFDQGCFGFSASQSVEAAFDCSVVTQSEASRMLGVSNSIWGLLFYVAVAALTAAAAFNWRGKLTQFKKARALLIAVAMLYSVYLVYYQFFGIGELCALCLTSAGITTLIFVTQAADYLRSNPAIKKPPAMMNLKPARERVFMGALALAAAVLIGADFAYFNSIETADPFAETSERPAQTVAEREPGSDLTGSLPAECRYDTQRKPVTDPSRLVNFFDASKGDPNAPVLVIEYFDPNCPHCATVHPILLEVVRTHSDMARFVFKPFVLWPHSIAQSEALYAAGQEGKFFEMLELQFEHQQPSGLTEAQLRDIAGQIGMNPDVLMRRIESGIYRSTWSLEKQEAIDAGVGSTPTILIDGRFVASESRTVDCLRKMIEQAAKS